jgi:hypothetical protein
MSDSQREVFPDSDSMMVSIDEVVAQLTERGRLEWELASMKAINARLQEQVRAFEDANNQLQRQIAEASLRKPPSLIHDVGYAPDVAPVFEDTGEHPTVKKTPPPEPRIPA